MQFERLPDDEQPIETDLIVSGGVFIKRIRVKRAGTFLPQHAHDYEHASYVAAGRARIWRDAVKGEIVEEGSFVNVTANVKHLWETLVDRTTILCIHLEERALAVAEEHQL